MKGYKKLMDFVALVEKAVLAATMILVVDIVYAILDPRIKYK